MGLSMSGSCRGNLSICMILVFPSYLPFTFPVLAALCVSCLLLGGPLKAVVWTSDYLSMIPLGQTVVVLHLVIFYFLFLD